MTNKANPIDLQKINRLVSELTVKLNRHLGPELLEESVEIYTIRRLLDDLNLELKKPA